jgi:hypothetical protein
MWLLELGRFMNKKKEPFYKYLHKIMILKGSHESSHWEGKLRSIKTDQRS